MMYTLQNGNISKVIKMDEFSKHLLIQNPRHCAKCHEYKKELHDPHSFQAFNLVRKGICIKKTIEYRTDSH